MPKDSVYKINYDEPLEDRLSRCFDDSFYNKNFIKEVLTSILSQERYSFENISSWSEDKLIDELLEIQKSDDVKVMQEVIEKDLKGNEESLQGMINKCVIGGLKKTRILPSEDKIEISRYRDFWFTHDNKLVFKGLWDLSRNSDEKIIDKIYEINLKLNKKNKPNKLSNMGIVYYYREKLDKTKKVKEILKDSYQRLESKISFKAYKAYEKNLLNQLDETFNFLNKDKKDPFKHLYFLFESVKTLGVKLNDYVRFPIKSNPLTESINELMPLPYVIVKSRNKTPERIPEKFYEAFFNLVGDSLGKEKKFSDLYGVKLLQREIDEIFIFANTFKDKINQERIKNYFKKPKIKKEKDNPNRYQPIKKEDISQYESLHLSSPFGGINFEIQCRTHEIEYQCEFDQKLSHEDKYMEEKNKKLSSIPNNLILFLGCLMGFGQYSQIKNLYCNR